MRNLSGSLYVILLAARLYFFFACCLSAGLLVTMLKNKPSKSGAKELTHTLPEVNAVVIPEVQRQGKRTVWISTLAVLLGVGLGYLGTMMRDEYWPSKLEDFLITANNADGSHVGVDKYGREQSAKWCSGPDDLIPGNKIPVVYYRQMPTCKIIHGWYLGYSVYSYKDGTRMLFPIPKETANAR